MFTLVFCLINSKIRMNNFERNKNKIYIHNFNIEIIIFDFISFIFFFLNYLLEIFEIIKNF